MYRRPKNGGFTGILSLKKDSEEISQIFEGKKLPSVLGSDRFIDWAEKIKHLVCKAYHVSEGDVLQSKRGPLNEARNVAMYLTRRLRGDGLDRICEEFHLNHYSSASSTIEKVRVQISKDPELRGRVFSLVTPSPLHLQIPSHTI